jgi:hypothetical protein
MSTATKPGATCSLCYAPAVAVGHWHPPSWTGLDPQPCNACERHTEAMLLATLWGEQLLKTWLGRKERDCLCLAPRRIFP